MIALEEKKAAAAALEAKKALSALIAGPAGPAVTEKAAPEDYDSDEEVQTVRLFSLKHFFQTRTTSFKRPTIQNSCGCIVLCLIIVDATSTAGVCSCTSC
jgi:hypothetical protein